MTITLEKLKDAMEMASEALKQPEQKKGQWLLSFDGTKCSNCGYKLEMTGFLLKCPCCGARMEGEE